MGLSKTRRPCLSRLSTTTADSGCASGSNTSVHGSMFNPSSAYSGLSACSELSALGLGSRSSRMSAASSSSTSSTPLHPLPLVSRARDESSTNLNHPLLPHPSPDPIPPSDNRPQPPPPRVTVTRCDITHARSSRCPRASIAMNTSLAVTGPCVDCQASGMHSLMAKARFLPLENFNMIVDQHVGSMAELDIYGNTCLHAAAASWLHPVHLESLRRAGVDLNARNSDGQLFLHVLSAATNPTSLTEMMHWMSTLDVDLAAKSFDGDTILHVLLRNHVEWHVLEQVRDLLFRIGERVNDRNRFGLTPVDCLKTAWRRSPYSEYRNAAAIQRLDAFLKAGLPYYDPEQGADRLSARGRPLSLRSQILEKLQVPWSSDSETRYETEMLSLIEASHEDPGIQDHRGRNALHCLAFIIRYPEYRGSTQPPLARLERVRKCIDQGVVVNQYDGDGSTPLHSFLGEPRINDSDDVLAEIVARLLIQGAEPELRDKDGNTALHLACANGRPACVRVLLDFFFRRNNGMEMHTIQAKNDSSQGLIALTIAFMDNLDTLQNHLRRRCIRMIKETGLSDEPV